MAAGASSHRYSHSCVEDTNAARPNGSEPKGRVVVEPFGMGAALYPAGSDEAAANCQKVVTNRTVREFNGSGISYAEINTNDTAVKELRRAYYAAVTFMDAQLGRVLDELGSLELTRETVVTFIGDHGYQVRAPAAMAAGNTPVTATPHRTAYPRLFPTEPFARTAPPA